MKMKTNPNRSWLDHVLAGLVFGVGLCWGCQGAFGRPASAESSRKDFNGNADFTCPVGHGLSSPIVGNPFFVRLNGFRDCVLDRPSEFFYSSRCHFGIDDTKLRCSQGYGGSVGISDGVSSVHHLFSAAGPSTIGFGVVSIHINAVNGEAGRAFTHVGEEVFERFPSWIIGDSSAAIVGVLPVPWVIASVFQMAPRIVGICCPFNFGSYGVTVGGFSRSFPHDLADFFSEARSLPSGFCSASSALAVSFGVSKISEIHRQWGAACFTFGFNRGVRLPAWSGSAVDWESFDHLENRFFGFHAMSVGLIQSM